MKSGKKKEERRKKQELNSSETSCDWVAIEITVMGRGKLLSYSVQYATIISTWLEWGVVKKSVSTSLNRGWSKKSVLVSLERGMV
jgi:hypothetical protein